MTELADIGGLQRAASPLEKVLNPRTVAVIGASDRAGNPGGVAVGYLLRFGFPGEVWPVNPGRTTVAGLPCFATVDDLPSPPDLAILAVAAAAVPDLVRECAAAGIEFGVVWAGGFAETGEEGAALQEALAQACEETGFRVVGPNCVGVINSELPMTATFAAFLEQFEAVQTGDISIVSQSGGIATMAQALALRAGVGFRYMVSVGNEVSLAVEDFVEALAQDDGTRVIALYLEGLKGDGRRFADAVSAAVGRGKSVIVLKGGLAPRSAMAAAAHTGAFAGEGRVWRAVLAELGAIRVDSLEELIDTALLSSTLRSSERVHSRIALVGFGGGLGVLATDQCIQEGLALASLDEGTRAQMRLLAPSFASLQNPVDLTPKMYGSAQYLEHFPEVLRLLAQDEDVDVVLAVLGPMATGLREVIDALGSLRDASSKPVAVVWPLATAEALTGLRARGFHVFDEPARAIRALANLARRNEPSSAHHVTDETPFDWAEHVPDPRPGRVIAEHECHALLRAAGVAVAAGALVTDARELEAAMAEIGSPVAMKGISERILHRQAAGLVQLGVEAGASAHAAYAELVARACALDVELDGVYLQRMVDGGVELLLSAFRDPTFGVMLSCGAGGVLTEALDDVVLARCPVDEQAAAEMLGRLRVVAGTGSLPGELQPVAEYVARFSRLAATIPWDEFVLELNPVKWTKGSVVAIDGLLLIPNPSMAEARA